MRWNLRRFQMLLLTFETSFMYHEKNSFKQICWALQRNPRRSRVGASLCRASPLLNSYVGSIRPFVELSKIGGTVFFTFISNSIDLINVGTPGGLSGL